jgi:hypothetical protein
LTDLVAVDTGDDVSTSSPILRRMQMRTFLLPLVKRLTTVV